MARFYLDTNVGPSVGTPLSEAGHEIAYAVELGLGDERDAFHVKEAADRSAILLTFDNGDFRTLHRLWTSMSAWTVFKHHSGMITATRESPGLAWSSAISNLIRDEGGIGGQFWTWHPQTGTWHRDRF